jgi:hypothetical protein
MIDQVAPSGFAQWIASMATSHPLDRAVLLDVREPHELQWASVASSAARHGFQWVAIPMGQLPARLSELDPDQPWCTQHASRPLFGEQRLFRSEQYRRWH